ncbi:hydantoinase/oxoprolinase family protein [Acuticoccus mangrovi]|uniref:Hydantoinase/oxoprolinase family protein n=1 Tax=Acuticoccus mangrovi TaxID=2796142 RepID=A0A934ITY6_9HYPH|nr:hydantoinase/oxoprolinase family protein [Acuticoccus mangrovi]MBJ3778553.1 hydantoinase/oxoprolinase family protein [Acuticoccus mangrovi]
MGYRVGVDVGGSFTDFAVFNEADATISTLKVLSRPDAPGEEISAGLDALHQRHGIAAEDISYFTHGTTAGVNAVIQRKGCDIALFTTRNFEDVLQIARLKIPQIHNLYSTRPEPLVARERVFGIDERIDASGAVLKTPSLEDVAAATRAAQAAGCTGIVVCFLHSYRNPQNEAAVKAMIAETAPDLAVFSSAETWPIIREYERAITAVISGYVQPTVVHYLNRFEAVLREKGVTCPLHITKTNGGVMGMEQAKTACVQMILSGTASGVIGAGYVAKTCGFPNILSLDIGGTSADAAVIIDGEAQYGVGELIGDFQIHVPSVSVSSIGQGGGSVAWVDALGVLKVGPDSAGSNPGPVSYGRGGTRPTITDAVAASNLIGHTALGYGAVTVDHDAARSAIAPLADRLGISIEETVANIIEISVSSMYAEISGLASRFGIDPREFHLFAFGGAGPMLACFLARELHMKGVVVPLTPGVVSALGGVIADLKNDFVRTLYVDVTEAGVAELATHLEGLKAVALDWLYAQQGYDGEAQLTLSADMRYLGQSYEIETLLDPAALTPQSVSAAFHAEHRRLYGHAEKDAAVQLVNLRLVVSGATAKPRIRELPPAEGPVRPMKHVTAFFDAKAHDVPVYARADLRPGHRLSSPAIIGQDDTTTVIPPRFDVVVDRFGNLVITSED